MTAPARTQHPVELILARQLASYLAMPILLIDVDGNLLYYNEPAEALVGRRYEETGAIPLEEWSNLFSPTDEEGRPIPSEARPTIVALRKRRAAHSTVRIRGLDGVPRRLGVTAFPLDGVGGRQLGAIALFWEMDR